MKPGGEVEQNSPEPRTPRESSKNALGPRGPLRGTMSAPPVFGAPLVLIIPGSGPIDRDGNSLPGVRASTYRLITERLAERGIASVRVDKCGHFGSHSAVPDGNAVTIQDYAADARTWIAAIRKETGASGVWVPGHSAGGLVALPPRRACGICTSEGWTRSG